MSAKMLEKKRLEGQEHLKAAKKLASRTVTRWKPDWEGAALSFDKAGTAFKNAKEWQTAYDTYLLASDAQYHCESVYTAAKHMDNAAQMAEKLGDLVKTCESYRQAALLYRENGNGQRAAESLLKAARIIEATDPDTALEIFTETIDVFETEDKIAFSHETFRFAVALMVKTNRIDKAIELLKRQMDVFKNNDQMPNLWKVYLGIVVLYLRMEDFVAAEQFYQESLQTEGYFHSKESQAANQLLDAIEKRDEQALAECQKLQVFNFLDQQIIKSARGLTVDGEFNRPDPTADEVPEAASGGAGDARRDELLAGAGHHKAVNIKPMDDADQGAGSSAPASPGTAPAPAPEVEEEEDDNDDLL